MGMVSIYIRGKNIEECWNKQDFTDLSQCALNRETMVIFFFFAGIFFELLVEKPEEEKVTYKHWYTCASHYLSFVFN